MLAKDLAPNAFPAASLGLGCCQEVNTVIVEWESIYIIIYLYIPIFKEHFAASTFVILKIHNFNPKVFQKSSRTSWVNYRLSPTPRPITVLEASLNVILNALS